MHIVQPSNSFLLRRPGELVRAAFDAQHLPATVAKPPPPPPKTNKKGSAHPDLSGGEPDFSSEGIMRMLKVAHPIPPFYTLYSSPFSPPPSLVACSCCIYFSNMFDKCRLLTRLFPPSPGTKGEVGARQQTAEAAGCSCARRHGFRCEFGSFYLPCPLLLPPPPPPPKCFFLNPTLLFFSASLRLVIRWSDVTNVTGSMMGGNSAPYFSAIAVFLATLCRRETLFAGGMSEDDLVEMMSKIQARFIFHQSFITESCFTAA